MLLNLGGHIRGGKTGHTHGNIGIFSTSAYILPLSRIAIILLVRTDATLSSNSRNRYFWEEHIHHNLGDGTAIRLGRKEGTEREAWTRKSASELPPAVKEIISKHRRLY